MSYRHKLGGVMADEEQQGESRRRSRGRRREIVRQDVPVLDLKALLAAAPLEGVDLERDRDFGRALDGALETA